MDWGDLEPQKQKPKPKNLEEMSISALNEYIEELNSEILRVKAMIEAKELARDGADSVFKN